MPGRLDPNSVLDTKFYSQNPAANQTNTGVKKVDINNNATLQNLDGTEILLPRMDLPDRRDVLPENNSTSADNQEATS